MSGSFPAPSVTHNQMSLTCPKLCLICRMLRLPLLGLVAWMEVMQVVEEGAEVELAMLVGVRPLMVVTMEALTWAEEAVLPGVVDWLKWVEEVEGAVLLMGCSKMVVGEVEVVVRARARLLSVVMALMVVVVVVVLVVAVHLLSLPLEEAVEASPLLYCSNLVLELASEAVS